MHPWIQKVAQICELLSKGDINEILLVGGQTRMPLVQKKVSEFFGKDPRKDLNPESPVLIKKL